MIAWHDDLQDWANAKNQVTIQLEDSQFGTLPAHNADWGPRLNLIINEIEQADPVYGGVIECYPEQKKISTTVNLGAKKGITIRSAGLAANGNFSGRGLGAGFYMGTSGMTMFQHLWSASVNHWGPTFEGINFSAVDFPTTGTLVLLENVNQWGFRNCGFMYGNVQLKVDPRLDLGGGGDASYGQMDRLNFSQFNSRGVVMGSMAKAHHLNFFDGVAGSWCMEFTGTAANGSYHGIKIDSRLSPECNGVWMKGYLNSFFHLATEGSKIGLRLDRDPALSYTGQGNRFYDLHTTVQGTAGEVGVEVTSISNVNAFFGYQPWGTPGAGGAHLSPADGRGKLFIVSDADPEGVGPIVTIPNRPTHPTTPNAGAHLYALGGVMYTKGADGVARAIGNGI